MADATMKLIHQLTDANMEERQQEAAVNHMQGYLSGVTAGYSMGVRDGKRAAQEAERKKEAST